MKQLIRMIIVVSAVVLAVSCAGNSRPADSTEPVDVATAITAQYRKISAQMAKEMMDSGEPVTIVDVRTEAEYDQGHIPGAILIPNESISTSVHPALLDDAEATILIYCRSGNRSAQAARKLVALGYTNVYDFGGIINWPYETVR